ncbi:LPD7 domain-containing protein [Paraburkholderia sp. JHI869]
MVEVAKAKNWSELQIKGTEEFRRQAWIAAELAGVPTRGFRPKQVIARC